MDFASLMSSSISKAKGSSSSDDKAAAAAASKPTPAKKYISRREAEEQRRATYLAEQAALEEKRAARAAEKRKREEDAAEEAKAREEKRQRLAEESRRRREEREAEEERQRRRRLGLPELSPGLDAGSEKEDGSGEDGGGGGGGKANMTDEELVRKLRERGQPATLFGETRALRLKRYRKLTTVMSSGPIPTTLQLVEEKDMKVSGVVPPALDKAGRRWMFRQLASYFTMVLSEWQLALAAERAKTGGDTATAGQRTAWSAMVQCVDTMKPLFRKFETGDLDESVLEAIVEIVQAAQERRYVDANDGYLRLSIGKAAWPIGVTMVGIHERSAREKLHNGERGHVMGDEVTRKYLQSIKRCLTFAQVRWPPEDIRQLMG